VQFGTDYQGFAGRQTKDPLAMTFTEINKAAKKSVETMRKAHMADYAKYFQRVSLQLGVTELEVSRKPTPERIQAFKTGATDPALAALYFNFGRYLLISSSRPGGLPPNLQGIWAEELSTPWTGDWHLDVNVQMNYWPAEICNLSDLHQPLFALIDSLQEPGARTAREYYAARGWVAHVIPIRGASLHRESRPLGIGQQRFGLVVPPLVGSLALHARPEVFAPGLSDFERLSAVLRRLADPGTKALVARGCTRELARESLPNGGWPHGGGLHGPDHAATIGAVFV
jgi:hypothetical protein